MTKHKYLRNSNIKEEEQSKNKQKIHEELAEVKKTQEEVK